MSIPLVAKLLMLALEAHISIKLPYCLAIYVRNPILKQAPILILLFFKTRRINTRPPLILYLTVHSTTKRLNHRAFKPSHSVLIVHDANTAQTTAFR